MIVKNLLLHHRPKNSGIRRVHVLVKLLFEIAHLLDWEVIQESASAGKNDQDLFGKRQRRELCLFQEFYQTFSAIELRLRGLVQIAAKLRECRQFAILRQFELERPRHLPHGFDLRAAAHAAHRQTHVHGRPHTLVKQVSFQIDLTVGNRNDVGRNISGDVAGLRFDNGQCGQRAAAVFVAQLRRTFQQAGVQVEHISRISLASRRATQQQ